jgi:hypothetical protein
MPKNSFITSERRVWMRLRDHTVVFEQDPQFERFVADPNGSVLRILRIWVAQPTAGSPQIRRYIGSVRRCECGDWMSHRELVRLFRRATAAARHLGESAPAFRARLSRFLRDYYHGRQPIGRSSRT